MINQQPIATSSLLDTDYEEPSFQSTEAKFFIDPFGLMDRLTQKHIVQQDRSKVSSDLDAVPVAMVLRTGMFDH